MPSRSIPLSPNCWSRRPNVASADATTPPSPQVTCLEFWSEKQAMCPSVPIGLPPRRAPQAWAQSSIRISLWRSASAFSASRSHGLPARWTAMIAFVRGVIRRATSSGSRLYVSRPRSAKTGTACWNRTPMTVPMSVIGLVITSSPGPIPAAATAMWRRGRAGRTGHHVRERARLPEPLEQERRLRPLPVEERVLPDHRVEPFLLGLAPADELRDPLADRLLAAVEREPGRRAPGAAEASAPQSAPAPRATEDEARNSRRERGSSGFIGAALDRGCARWRQTDSFSSLAALPRSILARTSAGRSMPASSLNWGTSWPGFR